MAQPTRKPTYAENLLYHAGFSFQPRHGERLNLTRIANANIEKIVDEVDTEKLNSFLENITFCEMTEEDLHMHSDATFVKLFQIAQLIIEYLIDAQDTLSANLNGLAKKYAAKKREIENLSKNLARHDEEVANLRDELYYHRQFVKSSISINSKSSTAESEGVVSRVDPSLYPSQERRPTPTPASQEADSSESSVAKSQQEGTIRLHIVSSTQALYLQMCVEDSLTIHNLKNKIVGRFLVGGHHHGVNFESYALYHKDNELEDPSQTLRHYHVANDAALVIMPRPVEETAGKPSAIETTDKTSNIETKLEELTSIAAKSQDELIQAARTLQFQVSTQESSKEAFAKEFGHILKSLVHEAVMEHSTHQPRASHTHDDAQQLASPLSKLNMGELVETDGGNDEDSEEQDESVSKNKASTSGEDPKNPSFGAEMMNRDKADELKIDTSAEVLDREVSPFNPPSEIEVTSGMTEDSPQEKEGESKTEASSMRYSASASSTNLSFSVKSSNSMPSGSDERTPTPLKGYLDRKVPAEEEARTISPFHKGAAVASPGAKYEEMQQFSFSEFESSPEQGNDDYQGIADIVVFSADEYNRNDSTPDTCLKISTGQPMEAMDSDLQSIELESVEDAVEARDGDKDEYNGEPVKKKKGRFSNLKKAKNRMSIKNIMGCRK